MDAASCGPSNALQNLSKHTQRDNTLQNEFLRNQPQQGNGFRTQQMVDQRLNQDFKQFNEGSTFNQFQSGPIHPQFDQHRQQHNHQQNHTQYGHHQPQQGWVQDFSNMSINSQPNQHSGKVQGDWQHQFMNQHRASQQPMQTNMHQPQHQMGGFQMNMRTNLSSALYQTTRGDMSEHQEMHKMEQEKQIFDDQFDQVERELQQANEEQVTEMQPETSEFEKEQFAKTAKQVQESMLKGQSEETNAKFQNSNFLKLMSLISNRSVELEGDKLVNRESGEDIRENPEVVDSQPTPAPPSQLGHQTNHMPISRDETSTHDSMTLHLPDPLAHIKKGMVVDDVSPFQAAQIVSGNQVKTSDWMDDDDWLDMTEDAPFPVPGGPQRKKPSHSIVPDEWQEVYDDYRHDDDYH